MGRRHPLLHRDGGVQVGTRLDGSLSRKSYRFVASLCASTVFKVGTGPIKK